MGYKEDHITQGAGGRVQGGSYRVSGVDCLVQGEGSKVQGVRPRGIGEKGGEEGTRAEEQSLMKENRACPKRFFILQILSKTVVINFFTY